jgi:hypothetical protein
MGTMATILNTLGLGAPDPASYTNAATMANQQKEAVGNLQTTVSTANTALTFAKTAGVSSDVLTKLQTTVSEGNTLLSRAGTMTPAELEAQRAKLESNAIAAQFAAIQDQYNTQLKELRDILPSIRTRVNDIREDKSTSAGLVSEYNSLLNDLSGSIALLVASPPIYTVTRGGFGPASGSGSGSGSGSSNAYVIPTTSTAKDYQARLDTLDGKKEKEEGTGYTWTRMWRTFKHWVSTYLYPAFIWILVFSSAILGGIIISNAYVEVEQAYLGNRLFYFIYGALGFPISIAYGCFKPPFWVAGLFPAYARKKSKQATPPAQTGGSIANYLTNPAAAFSGITTAAKDQVQGATQAATKAATQAALNNLPLSVTGDPLLRNMAGLPPTVVPDTVAPPQATENAVPVDLGVNSYGVTVESEVTDSDGAVTSILLKPTSSFDILSFVLVDSRNPPTYEKDGKTRLWYLSIVYTLMISSYAVTNNLIPTLRLPI